MTSSVSDSTVLCTNCKKATKDDRSISECRGITCYCGFGSALAPFYWGYKFCNACYKDVQELLADREGGWTIHEVLECDDVAWSMLCKMTCRPCSTERRECECKVWEYKKAYEDSVMEDLCGCLDSFTRARDRGD